jgi:hypothetical protein
MVNLRLETKRYCSTIKHSFFPSKFRERPINYSLWQKKGENGAVIITTNKALKALSEIKVELICQKLPFSIQNGQIRKH